MKPIQFIQYDKLSDDVLFLGSNLYLRMNVSLSGKNSEKNERYHFHKEYSYNSRYSESGLLSIKRSFNYYLSFEFLSGPDKVTTIIRTQDMILLREKLQDVYKFFIDDTFATKGTKLVIKRKRQSVVLDGLCDNGYLQFDPVAIIYESTGNQTPGVRITLNNPNAFADIDVDHFFSLLYTINGFDMYTAAQNLINYLGRPSFGMNLYEVEDMMERKKQAEDFTQGGIDNRSIPKRNKSFFDKMNELKKENE